MSFIPNVESLRTESSNALRFNSFKYVGLI